MIEVELLFFEETKIVEIFVNYEANLDLADFAERDDMFLTITINGKGGGIFKIQIDVEANDGKPYLIPEPKASYKFGTEDNFSIFLGYPKDADD